MALLDWILNCAALLLWLGWRAVGIDRASRPAALSLGSVLKRAEPQNIRTPTPLLVLLALLIGRSVVYWWMGPSLNWTPTLDLGVVAPSLRPDFWSRMILFSFASFLRMFAIVYLWLLLMAVAARHGSEHDPVQPLLENLVGRVSRWPWPLVGILAFFVAALGWCALSPAIKWLGLTGQTPAATPLWQQSVAFALSVLLTGCYPAALLMFCHAINTYVWVGNSPWWHLAARAGHNLVRWIPVAIGKVDLAPLIGIIVAILLARFGGPFLVRLFNRPLF
jgi:hypothetical protein